MNDAYRVKKMCPGAGYDSDVSVTLVHGTIPGVGPIRLRSRSDWTAEDAPIPQALSSVFPGATISSFRWTGENSHRARIEAASELAKHLIDQHHIRPHVKQLVVTHSHGGNVCLYAMKLVPPEVKKGVLSIACLGTPFLLCFARDVAAERERLGICLLLGMICWTAVWLVILFSTLFPQTGPAARLWSIVPPVILLCGFIATLRFRFTPIDEWRNIAMTSEDRLTAAADPSIALLCMSVTRDEASILLRGVDATSSTVRGIWAQLVDSSFARTLRNPFALLSNADDDDELKGGMGCAFWIFAIWPFMAALEISFFLSAVNLVLVVVLSIASLLLRSAPWGFGEGWLLHWAVEIRSQSTPARPSSRRKPETNTAGLLVLDIASSAGADSSPTIDVKEWSLKGFRHSAICWDHEGASFLAAWLAASIARKG